MYESKLKRFTQKIFGWSSGTREMVDFGTPTEGRPLYVDKMENPETIQTKYYEQGWFPESLQGNIRPYAEDMNGVHFLHSYQLAYMLQAGIPEWDSKTPYFEDCICRYGKILYISNVNNNVGNDPREDTRNEFWNVFTLGEQGVPVGTSLEWNGLSEPNDKWMFEDGRELKRTEYEDLYDVIGTTFGGRTDDGVEYFNLPNSTGKVAIGYQSDNTKLQLGKTGGKFNHQHFVPAHYHDLGDIRIIASGEHTHTVTDPGHFHSMTEHQHKFRFGDRKAKQAGANENGINVACLGSQGYTGTDADPTEIPWDTGVKKGVRSGHFYKRTSPAIDFTSHSDSWNLNTTSKQTKISIAQSSHTHRRGVFAGHVGAISKSNGDTGTMQTTSTNENTTSSNMPYIVKRKIIRVKR